MGTEPSKKTMKQQLALHKPSCDLGEDCNPKDIQQLQHEWKLISPQVQFGEREIIHKF